MSFFSKFGQTSIVTQKYELKTTKGDAVAKKHTSNGALSAAATTSAAKKQLPRKVASAPRLHTPPVGSSTAAADSRPQSILAHGTLKRKLESVSSQPSRPSPKRTVTESPSRPSPKRESRKLPSPQLLKPPSSESLAPGRARSAASSRSPRSIRLESSDDEDDGETARVRTHSASPGAPVSQGRKVVHPISFRSRDPVTKEKIALCKFTHAENIASLTMKEWRLRPEFAKSDNPPIQVGLNYPGIPQKERFQLVRHSFDIDEYDPISDILYTMMRVAASLLPEDVAEQVHSETSGGIVYRMRRALKHGDGSGFTKQLDRYNELVRENRKNKAFKRRIATMSTIPFSLVEQILQQAYARTVALEVESLRDYQAFSSEVYGELLPKFTTKIFREAGLTSSQVFVDLGSGTGNVVLHAALEIGCESWGCEKMDKPAELAQRQKTEFEARCRMWGLNHGAVHLEHDNFLENARIAEVLRRADVLLVNNFAFPPDLNQHLLDMFLDLKEGAQIISLRPFVTANHVITIRNVENPVNRLRVTEKQYFSREVSWTDSGGKYYVQTVDGSMLQEFMRRKEQEKLRSSSSSSPPS